MLLFEFLFRLFWLIVAMLPIQVLAREDVGIGRVAINIMEPVTLMSDFIVTACLVLGGAFVFASLIKYVEHRRSPLMVPISTVLFLLIAGVVLLLLPLASLLSDGSVAYSLTKSYV